MITQKEVAKRAGVSVMTVSRVINGNPNVKEETRKKILRIIEELDYHPNSAARSLSSSKIGSIGIVAPLANNIGLESNPYFIGLLRGIEWEGINRGFDILISTQRRHGENDFPFFRLFFEKKADGLIFLSANFTEKEIKTIQEKKIPCCIVGEKQISADIPVVDSKNREAMKTLVQHLIELGHKKIGFLHSAIRTYHMEERFAGFQEAIRENNIDFDPDWLYYGDFTEESGAQALDTLLSRKSRPTAIVCGTDSMALGVIRRARELGIKIPEDLSVTGFDCTPESRVVHPSLATMAQPLVDMGRTAAEILIDILEKRDPPPSRIEFDIPFVDGESITEI
ncbi:LacI family DNA-binding transcriptional regulator [Spirochaetia bacterium 38H-sp]|uniref:LacI family DNA-binding transcriptional regulator n=1 Tax=Rarispira pelagica TaxID=3141764 RepID=A0ABU9UCI0_9SPIR